MLCPLYTTKRFFTLKFCRIVKFYGWANWTLPSATWLTPNTVKKTGDNGKKTHHPSTPSIITWFRGKSRAGFPFFGLFGKIRNRGVLFLRYQQQSWTCPHTNPIVFPVWAGRTGYGAGLESHGDKIDIATAGKNTYTLRRSPPNTGTKRSYNVLLLHFNPLCIAPSRR